MGAVRQTTSYGVLSEGQVREETLSRNGLLVVMDFWQYHLLAGNLFQVRIGTITTPATGNSGVFEDQAEMSLDTRVGGTIVIASTNVSFRLAAGTLLEAHGKSAPGVTTFGAQVTPLPLRIPQTRPAAARARAQATPGGVTIPLESVTPTRQHWGWSQPIAAGEWPTWYDFVPRAGVVLPDPACYYVQVGGAGTASRYYASFDFLDDPSSALL